MYNQYGVFTCKECQFLYVRHTPKQWKCGYCKSRPKQKDFIHIAENYYGLAVRDNSEEELIAIGKRITKNGGVD